MLGGFFGIYVAQLLLTATAILGILAAAFGGSSADSSSPFLLGLLALVFYTLGVSGGVVALVRSAVAALLLLIAGVGGLGATIAVGPATASLFGQTQASPTPVPPTLTPRPFVTLVPISTSRLLATGASGTTAVVLLTFPLAGPFFYSWRRTRGHGSAPKPVAHRSPRRASSEGELAGASRRATYW
jgi:hypothetical protein